MTIAGFIIHDSLKKCSNCKEIKELSFFSVDKQKVCGRMSQCKSCKNKIYLQNKTVIVEKAKVYYANKIAENPNFAKENYWKNPEKNRNQALVYYKNNKEKRNMYARAYSKKRRKEDINYKISVNIRTRLYVAIRNGYKKGSAIKDLGCSIEELKNYLFSLFSSEMNWNNYGEYWHIDHKIPLSLFNLENVECFKKAVHYTNLQPLEKIANIKKGNKL